ncbi:MAG TPA: serine--tRNA ligase [Solirubrobacterales bacterium]|nr:serine--tRNA ligase [Solirubrobacterales bacterium]
MVPRPLLDLRRIREDPAPARAALARVGAAEDLDRLLELDARRRELLPEVEGLRAERNAASDAIGAAKREGGEGGDADQAIARMRAVSGRIKELEAELEAVEADREELAATIPNPPDPEAPDGDSDEDAVVLREVGDPPDLDFEARDHLEIGRDLGLIDTEKAAAASGSRFAYLLGDLVLVELALIRFAVGLLVEEGFTPVVPPVLVRERPLFGTGFFPGEREMIYEVPRDELFLVGTSEVALAALHADEIIEPGKLPLRYAGISTCFRREAGAAGKDTRGIFRVHQFDKVEMFSFVEPEAARDEHQRLLAVEERILAALEIPYRVVDIAAGDLGASAVRKFDCEAWIPSQGRYRELTSTSNTTDYQARRLGCRYRSAAGAAPEHVSTLNGTAVAIGRTLIAIIENRQRADGSVSIPPALVAAGAPEALG